MRSKLTFGVCLLAMVCCACAAQAQNGMTLKDMLKLAAADVKPFVIIENGGQGVLISEDGLVLTAAHVTFDKDKLDHKDEVDVGVRRLTKSGPWPGAVHRHGIEVTDAGPATYYQDVHKAGVLKRDGKAMIQMKDVGVLKLKTAGKQPLAKLPHIKLYSREKPEIKLGDKVYLCHFVFPGKPGEPTFLVSPLEVIGAANATMGVQYLAKGFFRWGSSGGAILKDGKVIGIQSNAFTVNTHFAGEIPLGHISFQLVYGKMIDEFVAKAKVNPPPPPEPEEGEKPEPKPEAEAKPPAKGGGAPAPPAP